VIIMQIFKGEGVCSPLWQGEVGGDFWGDFNLI